MDKLFKTLKGKLILYYSLLICLALISLGVYSYQTFSKSIKQKTSVQMETTARSVNVYCDQFFDEIDTMSLMIAQNSDVQYACNLPYTDNKDYTMDYIRAQNNIFAELNELNILKPLIESVYVLGANDMNYFFHPFKTWNPAVESRESSWYKEAIKADGNWVVTPIHINKQLYSPHMADIDKPIEVITYARIIKSVHTLQPIGVIAIDIKAEFLDKMAATVGADGVINILQQDGSSITANRLDNAREYITITNYSNQTGFTIQYSYYTDTLFSEINSIRKIMLWSVILLIFFSVITAGAFSHHIMRPVQILKEKMQLVAKGRFESIDTPSTNVEIVQMYQSFNYMSERIQQLIVEISNKEQQRLKHELYAIQVSINPHFIYNTLNCIRWVAMMDKNQYIADMIATFVTVMKTSVKRRGEFITVQEELDFIAAYYKLMQLRYNNFTLEMKIADDIQNAVILPFLIQPLVENAIFHGIAPLHDRAGLITISAGKIEDMLTVEITDNGVGMSSSRLEELHNEHSSDEFLMKIGLRSVYERIAVYYKERGYINIENNEGQGVRIVMGWPFEIMERGANDAESYSG